MGTFSGKIQFLKFDAKEYKRDILALIKAEFLEGARAFLRAAVVNQPSLVPIQTGMARGSFLNLGRLVKEIIPISPNPRFRNAKYYHRPGSEGEPKTPKAGQKYSTPEKDILKVTKAKMEFHFQIKTFHFLLEDRIGVHSGPWGSFEAGQQAFITRMSNLINTLPTPKAYIVRTEVSFGRGSGIISPPKEVPLRVRVQRTIRGP